MSKTYLVDEATMQKLSDADSALADLVMPMMLDENTDAEALNLIMENGRAIFEFQHKLVDLGLAEKVIDRSDREEVDHA